MRNSTQLGLVAGLCLLSSLCGFRDLPPESESPTITILGAKLIDGTNADPVEDSVVVIRGPRILAAGPRADVPVPKGGERIDARGQVMVPGLVDLHVHYFGDRDRTRLDFQTQLYFGVTTSRSIGVDTERHLVWIEEARAGKLTGPRLFTAGQGFSHPEGHPVAHDMVRRPDTPQDAQRHTQELAALKVDFIKMWVESGGGQMPKIGEEIQAAIIEEAQRRHIPVVAHISELADVVRLADLGVKDFLHTVVDQEPVGADLLRQWRDAGLMFTPTLAVRESGWHLYEDPGDLEDKAVRAGLQPEALKKLLSEEERKRVLEDPGLEDRKAGFEQALRFTRALLGAGIPVGAGSDSGAGSIAMGWGTHREMELLVRAGFSNLEAIRAATRQSAEIAAGPQARFGAIEADQAADLILLDADPLEDIRNTRSIARVMQAGRWLDRETLSRAD